MWSPPTCPTTQSPSADLPSLIASVHAALRDAANGKQQAEKVVLEPPVSIKKSITANHLITMEDGRPYKSLKRHLTARGLTPAQYREKWSLPFDYPMVAPNYSKARSELAKAIGLGQKVRAKGEEARGLSRGLRRDDAPPQTAAGFAITAAATPRRSPPSAPDEEFSPSIALICRARQSRTSSSSKQGCSGRSGGAPRRRLRSRRAPFRASADSRATDCKRTVQLWHGPPPFCGAEPFLPNR